MTDLLAYIVFECRWTIVPQGCHMSSPLHVFFILYISHTIFMAQFSLNNVHKRGLKHHHSVADTRGGGGQDPPWDSLEKVSDHGKITIIRYARVGSKCEDFLFRGSILVLFWFQSYWNRDIPQDYISEILWSPYRPCSQMWHLCVTYV